jgi:hypothetical protein
MNSRIKAAYSRVYEAERERDALIRETYQTGDVVWYTLGSYEIPAAVLDHCGDRLKVCGLSSGKEYWISAYRLAPNEGMP